MKIPFTCVLALLATAACLPSDSEARKPTATAGLQPPVARSWLITWDRLYPADVNEDRPQSAAPIIDTRISMHVRTDDRGKVAEMSTQTTDMTNRVQARSFAAADQSDVVVEDWVRCSVRVQRGPQGEPAVDVLAETIGSLAPPHTAMQHSDGSWTWQERQDVLEVHVTQRGNQWTDRSVEFVRPAGEGRDTVLLFTYTNIQFSESDASTWARDGYSSACPESRDNTTTD